MSVQAFRTLWRQARIYSLSEMRCPACEHDNREGARFCDGCGSALSEASLHRPVTATVSSPLPETVGGGRYEVRRLLGEGARKRVYAAIDQRLGRDVAVAVVKTDGLDDTGRQRIEREARAMAMLGDHPHIVTVFDVGDDFDQPYIVSQLMPGGSVADLLAASAEHRVSIEEALRIAVQTAQALEHAHCHGVVHRDLKPANVWRAAEGTVLLGDFGLAATTDHSRLTADGLVVGTVAYLAPEQAVGRAPDARSDLYSLGALLYELVTGRPPFLGDDAVSVISQHLNTSPVAPSWHNAAVPPALDRLILALLAKDPADRPPSASAVMKELEAIGETPVPAAVVTSAAAPSHLLTMGRLIGRAEELAQLTDAFDQAISGRSRLVMVVGEPGIGKTRLVEELAVYASVRGATVCWGHCYEGELGMPYLPFVEAFRGYVRERSDEDLRIELSTGAPEMATLVSELHQRFGDLPSSPALDGEAERMRLFEGVTSFIHNAAKAHPLVFILDDLHWADKPSLLLLQYLARNVRRDRVLFIGTYRDVELDRAHPLSDAVAALRREHLYDRVLLRGLSPEEVKSLIDAVDNQDSPLQFAQAIHRETEGNPFFVAEILRNLVEIGAITKVDGRWVGDTKAVADNLPEGVREVIGRRLSRLTEDCNRLLTVGAAMPGGFYHDVVARVLGIEEERMLDLLDEALAAQVVRERRDRSGAYEFSHALIRQTLYAELSTPRRIRLHRHIAGALETLASAEANLGELAYHCFHGAAGGDIAKAVDYATRAGDRARVQAAHEEAARFYDMALQASELADDHDSCQRAELLLALGESQKRAGDGDAAALALDEAAQLCRTLGDGTSFARVAIASVGLHWGGGIYRADLVSQLEEARDLLGDADLRLRARLLALEAGLYLFIDQARVRALADEAVAAARLSGDDGALASALNAWCWGQVEPAERAGVPEVLAEITRLAERAGDLDLANRVYISRFNRAQADANREEMESVLAALDRVATESRSPFFLANAAVAKASVAALEGRYSDAEELGSDALAHARRLRDTNLVNSFGILVFPFARERSMLADLEAPTRRAVAVSPTVAAWRAGLALLLCELGKMDEAAIHLDVLAANDFAAIAEDVAQTYGWCATAEIASMLGDADRAERLVTLLRPRAGESAVIGHSAYHGAVDRHLGLLDMTLGRWDDAVRDLTAAQEIHTRMRARPWMARTNYELARALVGRSQPGDRERAVSLLNEVLEVANELGMTRLVEQALATKLELQGVASSSPGTSIDVVAAGLSVEKPDLRSHASPDGRVTIMFSDIEGYTAITERLGDLRTQELLREHNVTVRSEVRSHKGVAVKSAGDGFMLAFAEPSNALSCAVALQRAVAGRNFAGESIRLRIGLHVGEVIREASDFYGRTVILAARVADQARGGEILVTAEVSKACGVSGDSREVSLKGLSGTFTVCAIDWRPEADHPEPYT